MTLSDLRPDARTAFAPNTLSPELPRGTALIVDDEPANCRLLSRMLAREGFRTIEANSGEQGLALFASERPDIVFMDVMMPNLNGLETTERLKELAGMDFVPVIFLTALRDEEAMIRCTAAGGDDFLSKPFSFGVLKSRIQAMERVRDLHRAVAAKQRALSERIARDQEEQALAERLFSRAITNRNVALQGCGVVQRPAAIFSGDLVLTQRLPDGGLRILVGDFTGHGLAAAIGALPVADIFHVMTLKGSDETHLLAELNRKLHQILPADRFMAACLISISARGDALRWWNGGMPSAWLRTAQGLRELESHALPLGILPELPERQIPRLEPLAHADHLLLFTDGLVEAVDSQGRMFGDLGFAKVLGDWPAGQDLLPSLVEALDAHCIGCEQCDDIAIVEVPVGLVCASQSLDEAPRAAWTWSLVLRNHFIDRLPSLAAALRPLGLLDGLEAEIGALQTILAELYANALEHGVLRLASAMKSSPEGFEAYYLERARRLAEGCRGEIAIVLDYEACGSGGRVRIEITDSGDGFPDPGLPEGERDAAQPWGRGIDLVRQLCESVVFRHNGTQVEAIYSW